MQYEVNEYVWDCPRRGPAIIVAIDLTTPTPIYTVAEIILSSRRLGRVARRREEELERYVNLSISEKAAQRLGKLWVTERMDATDLDETDIEVNIILKAAMQQRGIEPAWSP